MTPAHSPPAPPRRRLAFSVHSTIFLFLVSFRILNALVVRTFFQPDEFFQSLEPAWNMVFGDGWVTWEWRHGLRSIAHPAIFAALYKSLDTVADTLNLSGNTRSELLIYAPRTLQAMFAAMGDWATARLAGALWGSEVGWVALVLSTGSAWQWFCSTRTFSNSLETVVTAIALSVWPWSWASGGRAYGGELSDIRITFFFAAFACVLRPTNLLIWLALGLFALYNSPTWRRRLVLTVEAIWIGLLVLSLNGALDYYYYNTATFPPLTFIKFNVLHSLSSFYGRNDWHYYLSQGFPLLCTSFLPLALYAVYAALRTSRASSPSFQLASTLTVVTTIYSLIAHKEVRFLYPLLPALHALSAKYFQRHLNLSKKSKTRLLTFMVLLNVPIAYYASTVHQRGVIDVISHLRDTQSNWSSVGFLMPCHSTPWSSSLGLGGNQVGDKERQVWALTCEPPVHLQHGEGRADYVDEADEFYKDPIEFLKRWVGDGKKGKRYAWPSRLVMFEQLEGVIGDELRGRGYKKCWSTFNSHWHDDWRRKGDVMVYCKEEEGVKGGDKNRIVGDW